MLKETRRHRHNFVELFPQRELALEFLTLFWGESFDGNLVALCQPQHHFGKRLLPDFFEKGDGVASLGATKAVVHLLGGIDVEAGGFFLVKGTQADKFSALLAQDDMFGDDIVDIGTLLDFFDGVGVQARGAHLMYLYR